MNESTLVPREEISDLDWLARNLHEWPEGKREALVCWPRNVDALIWSSVLSDAGWIAKDQWLARRAELQNKPSWDDAPEWAEWLAQDEDGEWKWLAGLPGKYVDGWTAVKIKGCCKGLVLCDWRYTLEKRPDASEMPSHSNQPKPSTDIQECAEVKQFEPFVSVEDAVTSKQHDPVNSPSHYASGGIECIEAIKASMSHEAFLGYLKGNVQKYMWRYEKKVNPEEDLKKAKWYLSKLIEEQK